MCVLRFKAALALVACLGVTSLSQAQTPDAPRIGEVAPILNLPTTANNRVSSADLLGKKSQFWIVEGSTPLLKDLGAVTKSVAHAVTRGLAPLVVQSSPTIPSWPAPFQTLRDTSGSLVKQIGPSTFVAVDRAGWVRDIQSLPSAQSDPQNFALRFLLERSPDPTPIFAVDKPAPDFCLRDANGVFRRLSALRGRKNLVLTFFPKCFTGKCKSHLSSLRDNYGSFQLADTEVWAVSVDAAGGEQGQRAFAQSLGLQFPMLPDTGRNLCFLFNAVENSTDLAKRKSVLIDKDGIVRWIDSEVAPETHGEDVLARLKALGMIQ